MDEMLKKFYGGKRVLVTGAAGTVGRELVRQLVGIGAKEIRLMDNNETEMFFMFEQYKGREDINCFLGDVRDRDKLMKLSEAVDVVIHTAAYKHVIMSEYNAFDVVQTNILGTENVIRAAMSCGVRYTLFTSSDKAVNPTNVMGTSKLMGERLVTAANAIKKNNAVFSSTRFGNVIGSRGSVLPVFMKQIKEGGPVTLTDSRMTRFIMTVEEAARLVLKSVVLSKGGEVFVTKMPVMCIKDLAQAMIDLLAPRYGFSSDQIEIVEIGAKAGEKFYEELMTDEETGRAIELGDMFAITPAFKSIYQSISYKYDDAVSERAVKRYVSNIEPAMDVEQIKRFLAENKLVAESLEV